MTAQQRLVDEARKEGEVILWAHTWRSGEYLLQLFKEKYPFLTVKIWDSGSVDVQVRLIEEAKGGRRSVDVITIGELETTDLHSKGLLQDYEWPNTRGWPNQPEHNFFRNFAGTGRVPIYNTALLSPAEAPKSWEDLKNPKWRGKTVASYSATETPLLFAFHWGEEGKLNWEKSEDLWREHIRATRPMTGRGYYGLIERMIAGEFALFTMAPVNATIRVQWLGGTVDFLPVSSIPADSWAVALVKNAPHPNAAKLFADFLTSREGLLAYSNANGAAVWDPVVAKETKHDKTLAARGIKTIPVPRWVYGPENSKRSYEFWLRELGIR